LSKHNFNGYLKKIISSDKSIQERLNEAIDIFHQIALKCDI